MKNNLTANVQVWGKDKSYSQSDNASLFLSSPSSSLMPHIRTKGSPKGVEYKGQNAVIHLSTALIKRGI